MTQQRTTTIEANNGAPKITKTSRPRWALLVSGEGVVGLHRLPARGVVVIGRGRDADLTLPHPSVSRSHVRLRLGAAVITVEDLGSRHGTVAGGRVLLPGESRVMLAGEVLQLGAVTVALVRT